MISRRLTPSVDPLKTSHAFKIKLSTIHEEQQKNTTQIIHIIQPQPKVCCRTCQWWWWLQSKTYSPHSSPQDHTNIQQIHTKNRTLLNTCKIHIPDTINLSSIHHTNTTALWALLYLNTFVCEPHHTYSYTILKWPPHTTCRYHSRTLPDSVMWGDIFMRKTGTTHTQNTRRNTNWVWSILMYTFIWTVCPHVERGQRSQICMYMPRTQNLI